MDASNLGGCREQSPRVPPPQADLPRLDPQETNVDAKKSNERGIRRDRLKDDVAFRHSGWKHDRALTRAAMERCEVPAARLARFDECGSNAWVVKAADDPERLKIIGSYCHDRFCRPCAAAHARQVSGNLANALEKGSYRFVTLTLTSTTESLAHLITKLVLSFRKLRSSVLWSSTQRGGAAFLEVKYNQRSQRWHPHLHIITEGRYIAHSELSANWKRITGDSYVVDVRKITDNHRAVMYVAKYAGKPLSNTFMNLPDKLDEAIRALHGRRLCTTFGTWRSIQLSQNDNDTLWLVVCPLSLLRTLTLDGNSDAAEIITSLGGKSGCKRQGTARASPESVEAISRLALSYM